VEQPNASTIKTGADIDNVVSGFGDLPTLAPVAMEVVRLADNEDASMADLAAAIGADPGLTARLMRLANSAMYGHTKEVTNLTRATTLLGLRTVKMLSLGFSLVGNLNDGPLDTSIIWRRSLATSVLARRLSEEHDRRQADDAFVAGLLSNIGKLALANEAIYVNAVNEFGPWMTVGHELDVLGFTSDEVTARILAMWGLPDLMSEVIRHRSEPSGEGPAASLAAVLGVADAAATLLLVESDQAKAEAVNVLGMAAATHLGLTIGQIEELIDEVGPDIDDIATMFDLEVIAATPISEIMMSAQAHMARLSLDMVWALSHEQQRNEELASDNERLSAQASTDGLTGLANRRTFDAYLENQIEGRRRQPRSNYLGLILFDLDHFKSVNDNFGHGIGDEVLRSTGARIQQGTRRGELSARIGGEEFAVVLPDVAREELTLAAERLRALVSDVPMDTVIGPLLVTTSVGACCISKPGPNGVSDLYTTADAALYASKDGGRNRVTARALP